MNARLRPWLTAPAGLVYLAGFFAPLAMMCYATLQQFSPLAGASNALSLDNLATVVSDRVYLAAFANSVFMSLVVVFITALLAYPICLYMGSVQGTRRNLILIAVIAPLLISVVVRTLGWQLLLGPRGVIERLFGFHLLYSNVAVVMGLVHLFLAHMILALLSVLGSIRKDVLQAARTLGSSELRIFWKIIFPLSLPGLLAGFVVVFGASAGALITPLFLGGARVSFASIEIYRTALVLFNWPLASALAVCLLAVNYAVIVTAEWCLRRTARGAAA